MPISRHGGRRPGAGRKPTADTPATKRFELLLTPSARWWWEHVADHAGMSLAEWLRMLADREIGEHGCEGCADVPADVSKRPRSSR